MKCYHCGKLKNCLKNLLFMGSVSIVIQLFPEPYNLYDSKAVKVMCGEQKLGNISRKHNEIKDMVFEWQIKKLPVFAAITRLDKSKKHINILIVMASIIMYHVENAAQPDRFSNAFSGMWWAIATLTTVGYGDIYPVTAIGKFLSAIIALLGIGLVAVPTGIISAGFMEQIKIEDTITEETQKKHYCPYCGKKLE